MRKFLRTFRCVSAKNPQKQKDPGPLTGSGTLLDSSPLQGQDDGEK